MTASRRAGLTAVLGVLGVLALLLVVAWAASVGPGEVLRGEGPDRGSLTPTPTPSEQPSGSPTGEAQPTEQEPRGGWFAAVVFVLGIIGLMVAPFIAVLLVRMLGESIQWRRPDPLEEGVEHDGLVEAIRDDLAEQEALLRAGPVADGIIGCWQRFERLAVDRGLPPRAAETSTEFVVRVLGRARADAGAVQDLAGLYREARFSDHPLGEEQRAAALDAVRRIAAGFVVEREEAR